MRIAFVSDTHLTGSAPAFDENLRIVREWVRANGIDHTIHLGDLSADGVAVPDQLAHARERLADWPGRLHVLPGNHDVGDNPGGESHALADAERLDSYDRLFGPDRWVIQVEDWTLLGLNAQLCGRGDMLEQAQLDWLVGQAGTIGGPLGLCLHKPLFRTGVGDGDSHHRYVPPKARAPLMAPLAHADLRFVAAGHTHQTRQFHEGGIEHVWVPSAAFTLPDGMQETIGVKEVGLMLLTVEGERHQFERIIPDGLVQHNLADHAEVYPAHAGAIRAAAAKRG